MYLPVEFPDISTNQHFVVLQIAGTILTYALLVFQLKASGTDGCGNCGFVNATCGMDAAGNTTL